VGDDKDIAEVISVGEGSVWVPCGYFEDSIPKPRSGRRSNRTSSSLNTMLRGSRMLWEIKPEDGEQVLLLDGTKPRPLDVRGTWRFGMCSVVRRLLLSIFAIWALQSL
jgi:hypothetical protein